MLTGTRSQREYNSPSVKAAKVASGGGQVHLRDDHQRSRCHSERLLGEIICRTPFARILDRAVQAGQRGGLGPISTGGPTLVISTRPARRRTARCSEIVATVRVKAAAISPAERSRSQMRARISRRVYSILEAESNEALGKVLENHPHKATGGTIQTLECLQIPAM